MELDRAELKSEIVAELISELSLRPDVFEACLSWHILAHVLKMEGLQNAPWRNGAAKSIGEATGNGADQTLSAWAATKIQTLEQSVRGLEQWRAEVELGAFTNDAHPPSNAAAVDPAEAVRSPLPQGGSNDPQSPPVAGAEAVVADRKTVLLEASIWDASLLFGVP